MQQTRDGLLTPPQEPPKDDIVKVTKSFENGYKWFYWIAGLSLVNSVANFIKGNFSFVYIWIGYTNLRKLNLLQPAPVPQPAVIPSLENISN